ncbi:MAG: thioesterase family protein [Alistipes sp.]|nr:dihydrolipoamide acyltransferase [Rikenellaceae bacterium]MBO4993561.1 thioesterase family protein [Alistipes sp.]MBO5398696.1 thioesterase family protein [Alistipes sp.]MBP3473764.1 thioesterase family protein [Alistipes sp.]MDO5486864.1 thioesterase family protein [Rikenellaceae bacterium]
MEIGLKYESTTVVSAANTAATLGSGDMDVFATPAMVALMENAAMLAVRDHLPEGSATVGTQISTSHLKASPLGASITASAELIEVDGRRLTFAVKAWDEKGTIGEGTHTRFVVDRERFLSKL